MVFLQRHQIHPGADRRVGLEIEIDFAGEDVVIVRGAEVRFDNDIPIRDSLNPSGEEFPNAEGWGEMLGAVDYELDGETISFTTSWDLLRETDGVFGYRLFAFERGELTSEVTFLSRILIPLPAPVLLGAAGLLLALKKRMSPPMGHRFAPMKKDN